MAVVRIALLIALMTPVLSAQNWTGFRGPDGSGIADNQRIPDTLAVVWKTAIPGLSHSSPVVWGERVYLVSAVSSRGPEAFAVGDVNATGVSPAADVVEHRWMLYALDRATGRIEWQREMLTAVPRVKRHQKASHASATPATDGKRIVALLGSEGLFCFDMDGRPLWRADAGLMDPGLWGEPDVQWGPASSPVIFGDLVLVQNDRQKDSRLSAYHLETGKEVWSVGRQEKPAWSTPVVYRARTPVVITNGANFLRGNDAATGRELWRISNGDAVVIVPSPVVSGDRVVITGGYPTGARPVRAITLGAEGSAAVAWQAERGSPYTPTPIIYRGQVYSLVDNGVLNAYDLASGEMLYRTRVATGAGFSASPVASDGKLYLASEDGALYTVQAGREYKMLAESDLGEALMGTPAITPGLLIVRGRAHVFGLGAK